MVATIATSIFLTEMGLFEPYNFKVNYLNPMDSLIVTGFIGKKSGDYIALYSQGSPSSSVASCPLYSNPAGYIALLELL